MNTQEENNKLIAEFMEINWKPVRGDYRGGNSVFNPTLFKSQLDCLSFCDEINIGKEADLAFYPMPDTKDYSLLYHSSWDWLMPVVEKIENLGFDTSIVNERFFDDIENKVISEKDQKIFRISKKYQMVTNSADNRDSKILAVYNGCVKFIKWHNKNQIFQ